MPIKSIILAFLIYKYSVNPMNRIFAEQLSQNLNNQLAEVYYLVGNDPLLLTESRDLLIQTATAKGFDERTEISIDQSTDWNLLIENCQSLGLFFNRQILILTLPENLSAPMQQHLNELVEVLHSDILLILQLAKFNKTIESQQWHKNLVKNTPHLVQVSCQTPSAEQLPRWLSFRAKAMNLALDKDAQQLLCYSYENNLLALKQSLDLLALLYPNQTLSYAKVQAVVEQSSIFTPFQWIDALLEGKIRRARRILQGLQAEDVQPVILLRTLQKELFTLVELSKPQQRIEIDQPLPTAQLKEGFDRLKIWQNRRPFFTQAFQRLTYRKLYLLIQQLADLERAAKQDFDQQIWLQLENFSLQFTD